MNYKADIQAIDAELHCAPQQPGEVREDYDARVAASKGKHWLRVSLLDVLGEEKGCVLTVESPYFDLTDFHSRAHILGSTLKEIKKMVIAREKQKDEKTNIITLS